MQQEVPSADGNNSDEEIAELRIQALLTKRVNEAEVSLSSQKPEQVHSYIYRLILFCTSYFCDVLFKLIDV